jgi:hypothetical protein
MKGLVLAAALVPPTIGLEVALELVGLPSSSLWPRGGLLVARNAIPLAIGPAILRYRVYDIDPLISRTVSYVFLTALLLGVYGGGVVGLG